ncbi:hypothetical protein C7974DRAFT_393721 [Boeremia exigua]|uniref:uncharacterized protein n=1 Tax=Boeremia exigua TaxID=749465 RepID=UPI001E8D1DF8|nr:uncharacterized protein C7974DRAFT_393721 [Boeremia exigua]KAH6629040.1 hypothetical protein C7974DRAFT_393721 [Boeremia exigua]
MGLLGGSQGLVDPEARDKYLLQVTAGPSYNPNTHTQVSVNSSDVHKVDNDLATTYLRVRIKDYHGLPKNAPKTCSYFNHPLHSSDRYSVAWSFVPKHDIAGTDLVMGFDFSHPVRDRLPPGTKTAVKIATTVLDPGLYADPFSDEPYLYGPMLSSCFTLRVGGKVDEQSAEEQLKFFDEENDGVIEEGGTLSGESVRDGLGIPPAWKARRKFFLDQAQLDKFTFEKGRVYHADFFNPYLDFSNFSLRLPGFSISVAKYVDEKTHHLRFVLKSRASGDVVFVVFFKLLFGKELEDTLKNEEQGKLEATSSQPHAVETRPDTTQELDTKTEVEHSRRTSMQREILGGSRAPSFQEPSGFKAPKSYTRGDESNYSLNEAANTLAQSISAAIGAMGFGSSSESGTGSGSDTAPRIHAKPMDELDNGAVEKYLKEKHDSNG